MLFIYTYISWNCNEIHCELYHRAFVREAKFRDRNSNNDRRGERDTTGRRGFGNEIERNGPVERAENGARAENGRTVCKSVERRGGWLRAERHREVIRKWNTYRLYPRVGLGTVIDGWWVDWLHRDRPLGDWPLSGVSITTSSSPAAYEGTRVVSLPTNPRSFLRKALPRSHPSFVRPDLRPLISHPLRETDSRYILCVKKIWRYELTEKDEGL